MKNLSKIIPLFIFFALAFGSVSAQNRQKKTPEQLAEKRMPGLSDSLSLSPDQQGKVKALLIQDITQSQELKAKYAGNREAGKNDFKALRKAHKDGMQAILTPAQFSKWLTMLKEEKEDRQEKREHKF